MLIKSLVKTNLTNTYFSGNGGVKDRVVGIQGWGNA